jgi:hypothetical protein
MSALLRALPRYSHRESFDAYSVRREFEHLSDVLNVKSKLIRHDVDLWLRRQCLRYLAPLSGTNVESGEVMPGLAEPQLFELGGGGELLVAYPWFEYLRSYAIPVHFMLSRAEELAVKQKLWMPNIEYSKDQIVVMAMRNHGMSRPEIRLMHSEAAFENALEGAMVALSEVRTEWLRPLRRATPIPVRYLKRPSWILISVLGAIERQLRNTRLPLDWSLQTIASPASGTFDVTISLRSRGVVDTHSTWDQLHRVTILRGRLGMPILRWEGIRSERLKIR